MSTTMLVAGLCSLFAVSLLFFGFLVSLLGGRGDVSKSRERFKPLHPESKITTQKLRRGHLDIPTTIEGSGASPRQSA